MKVEEGKIVFHCDYCGCYDFSDPNMDGVALLNEESSFKCPICGETLVSAAVNQIQIFSCPNCRGNLIPQSMMHPILRRANPPTFITDELLTPLDPSELNRILECVSCHNPMEVYPYGGAGNILIQGCARCGLIWLDFGELSRILSSHAVFKKRFRNGLAKNKKWEAY
jgi:Zn-finger nucleic acid-binding protein